jgi:hypothetical protein
MAYPVKTNRQYINDNIGSIMNKIYLPLMGRQFMHKLQLTPNPRNHHPVV